MEGFVYRELMRLRQLVPVASVSALYEFYRAIGDYFDPEGVIDHRMGQLLGRRLCDLLEMQVRVEGAEQIHERRDYAVICSHASYLDWALLLGYFPAPIRFIAKRELISVPIVGSWLRRRGVLIDRRAGKSAVDAIAAATRAEPERPILIFPEGTRSPDGAVAPFRKGGIGALAEAGLTLVPVGLSGTYEAFSRHMRYIKTGRQLGIHIGPAVDPAAFDSLDALVAHLEQSVQALVAGSPPPRTLASVPRRATIGIRR
jgi:1-acyl-sn-glycerol-3-phosphate acyltransferase